MQNFRELMVWQKSHALTLNVYRLTQHFPRWELYGLTSQSRRAAVSIAANIAEGCGRGSDQDFARFLQMAMGSACELEYHVLLAHDLQFMDLERHQFLVDQIRAIKRMLTGLMQRLKPRSQPGPENSRTGGGCKGD